MGDVENMVPAFKGLTEFRIKKVKNDQDPGQKEPKWTKVQV